MTVGVEGLVEVVEEELSRLGPGVAVPARGEGAQALGVGDAADFPHEQRVAALVEFLGVGPGTVVSDIRLSCHGREDTSGGKGVQAR